MDKIKLFLNKGICVKHNCNAPAHHAYCGQSLCESCWNHMKSMHDNALSELRDWD